MNQLEEDIRKGQYKSIYLLYGEENYLKEHYMNMLRRALIPGEDQINYNLFAGREAQINELISQADTLPFFAGHRLIAVKNSGWFKKDGDLLAEYLPRMPETTVLLFSEDEIDKRTRLYKAAKNSGVVLELKHPRSDELGRWLARRAGNEKKQIEKAAVELLLLKCGDDMNVLSKEMDKLAAYTYDREAITAADVENVCSERLESRVFKMIDAAASRKREEAVKLYRDLLFSREPSLKILSLTASHFRKLLLVRDLRDQGYDRRSIENRTGQPSFVVRGQMEQAQRYSSDDIIRILQLCAEEDEAVKTGRMNEMLAVESVLSFIINM